jgi:hypothetical protein
MIQLITQAEWYNELPISNQLDFSWIGKIIEKAQLQYLKPCIGEELYLEIETQYDTDTLTPANATLRDFFIKPFLAWRSFADSIIYLHGRTEAKGIRVNTDDTSEPLSTSALSKMQQETANTADFYKLTLLNYLNDNKDDYPAYKLHCGRGCRKTDSGIYTGWKNELSRLI